MYNGWYIYIYIEEKACMVGQDNSQPPKNKEGINIIRLIIKIKPYIHIQIISHTMIICFMWEFQWPAMTLLYKDSWWGSKAKDSYLARAKR